MATNGRNVSHDPSEIFARLAEPFPESTLEWRIGRSGIKKDGAVWATVLAYMDARMARKKLNDVVGHENWMVSYNDGPSGGVVATVTLRIEGQWIAKQDGAGLTEIEAAKGGISDAFKRACAVWGIGEYLYDLGDTFAEVGPNGANYAVVKVKGGADVPFRWSPPKLKPQFLPTANAQYAQRQAAADTTKADARAQRAPAQPAATPAAPAAPPAPAPARPATPAPSAGTAKSMDFKVPMGDKKNTPLRDLTVQELESWRNWIVTKKVEEKFAAFLSAIEDVLNQHTMTVAGTNIGESGQRLDGGEDIVDGEPSWLQGAQDDPLPF